MAGISQFDSMVITRGINIIRAETKDLHPELKGKAFDQAVIERLEYVVRNTQPTFHLKDRSGIGRNRSVFTRLLTKYSSQRNKNFMMLGKAQQRYNFTKLALDLAHKENIKSDKPGDASKIINEYKKASKKNREQYARSVLTIMLLSTLLLHLIDESRRRIYGSKRKGNYFINLIADIIEANFGNIYVVGNFIRSLRSKLQSGKFFGYDVSDVLASTTNTGIDAMVDLFNGMSQLITQEEYEAGDRKGELKWSRTLLKGVDESVSTILKFKGIPYDTAKRMISLAIPKSPKDKINKILDMAKEDKFSIEDENEFFNYMDKMLNAGRIDQDFYDRKEESYNKAQDKF